MEPTPDTRTQRVANALRAHGYRATSQRLLVAETLEDLGRHVPADELLAAVRERLPGISLPTVYSALDSLEDAGVLRRVAAGRGAALFDARGSEHQHTVCRRCGAVGDLEARVPLEGAIALAAGGGFAAEGAEVVVHGLCADCRDAAHQSPGTSRALRRM
jgi:Fe2+ or Zn2+ uptake regulation protein